MGKITKTKARPAADVPHGRVRVSQSDVPSYSLTQAIKIPQAIADNFALQPARPLMVAQALNTQPSSGGFRMLCGAAIAYGLTEGGYNAPQISVTALGRRIVAPTKEGDDALARREALLKPRVLGDVLRRYDSSKIPREDIACNVLAEMGVPRDATKRTLDLIVDGARAVGFVREINGVTYFDLQGTPTAPHQQESLQDDQFDGDGSGDNEESGSTADVQQPLGSPLTTATTHAKRPRVFISHSKNMGIVTQVKTMLNVAEVEYEIAVEEQSAAIPIPEKVFGAMRSCTAAIICVTPDESGDDSDQYKINENVLIEIGAAFVLYDKRVILLWDRRVTIPSNLQGLYRCNFEGDELSWGVGMQLMEAVKKFRG